MVRRYRVILVLLCALAFAQSACMLAGRVQREEQISKTFDLKSGCSITVHNTNGSISVEGWDQDKVDVLAVKTAYGYDGSDAERNLKRLEVTFDQSGNNLTINTHYPHTMSFGGGVQYTLRVPRKADVTLNSTNGRIQATDVQGQIRLGTTNGTVTAENIGGSLHASTTNGKVSAAFTRPLSGDVHLSTTNGSVRLALPEDLDADISASTTNGSIHSDFPITTEGSIGRHSLKGRIGKGGFQIRLNTTNGGISITRNTHQSV